MIEKVEQSGPEIGFFQGRCLIDDNIRNVCAALAWAAENDVQAALLLTEPLLDWLGHQSSYIQALANADETNYL